LALQPATAVKEQIPPCWELKSDSSIIQSVPWALYQLRYAGRQAKNAPGEEKNNVTIQTDGVIKCIQNARRDNYEYDLCRQLEHARSEALIEMSMNINTFFNYVLFLVRCTLLSIFYPEDGSTKFLRNFGKFMIMWYQLK
jgi:hypothetical protein